MEYLPSLQILNMVLAFLAKTIKQEKDKNVRKGRSEDIIFR